MPKWRSRGEGGGGASTTSTTDYPFTGSVEGGGTIEGTIHLPSTTPPEPQPPEPPEPQPPNGGNTVVDEGAGNASVSYPWLNSFVGYGTLYQDRDANYFRNINAGFNAMLTIAPGAFPPGYRVANGQKGGGYPSGQATGNEPIRLCPPPSGKGRLSYFTFCKVVITNPSTSTKGAFACGLGVVYVNGPSRPMFPYLGAAHDYDINAFRPETIGPGDTRSISMFRTDFIDNTMDGGAANFPDWPNWEMKTSTQTQPQAQLMYPAVGISFKNTGTVALQVGNIYAYGWVS
jgi:hypothetical protein